MKSRRYIPSKVAPTTIGADGVPEFHMQARSSTLYDSAYLKKPPPPPAAYDPEARCKSSGLGIAAGYYDN